MPEKPFPAQTKKQGKIRSDARTSKEKGMRKQKEDVGWSSRRGWAEPVPRSSQRSRFRVAEMTRSRSSVEFEGNGNRL